MKTNTSICANIAGTKVFLALELLPKYAHNSAMHTATCLHQPVMFGKNRLSDYKLVKHKQHLGFNRYTTKKEKFLHFSNTADNVLGLLPVAKCTVPILMLLRPVRARTHSPATPHVASARFSGAHQAVFH